MLPLLLTFQKLVELVALGERNHQLVEITEYNLKIFTDSGQRLETTLIWFLNGEQQLQLRGQQEAPFIDNPFAIVHQVKIRQ